MEQQLGLNWNTNALTENVLIFQHLVCIRVLSKCSLPELVKLAFSDVLAVLQVDKLTDQ